MRLGINVGYWGLGMGPQEQLEVVQEAERLGYDSVWAAEAYGSDAATVLAWLAAGTSTIKLASGIFQMPGRSAAMTAMTAATIDELSGGRMIRASVPPGPRSPRAGTDSASPVSCSAPASTSPSCARRWRGSDSSTTARRSSCRSPTGRARR